MSVTRPSAFLILADESATWRVAGLNQLDRVVLALNEWLEATWPNEIVPAIIFWHPDIPAANRWLPRHPRITHIRVTESLRSVPASASLLHTRVFVYRGGMTDLLSTLSTVRAQAVPDETATGWDALDAQFRTSVAPGHSNARSGCWCYLTNSDEVPNCEKRLLRQSGKPQDGIISRFLNRHLSRVVSQHLLRYDLTPTAWTISLFILPVASFFCLSRGDYFGIVTGAVLFQLYSMLDGCDGEIARATYQESTRGGSIDDFLDMLGSVLFVFGLGLGLFRSRASAYALEGMICAGLIVTNEWLSRHPKLESHRLMAKSTFLNEKHWWWLIEPSKRDVIIFLFLILALVDWPQWMLHLSLLVAAGAVALNLRTQIGSEAAGGVSA